MTCFVCGGVAVELHHILIRQEKKYRKYPDWLHHPINTAKVCVTCHRGNGAALSFETRMRWIASQDKAELTAWLDAAPYEARYRVAEVRRLVDA